MQAPSTETIVAVTPASLRGLLGPAGGGFVDCVDEVDVFGLGQAVLHCSLAFVLGASGLVTDDLVVPSLAARVATALVFVAILGFVLGVDARAGQGARVARRPQPSSDAVWLYRCFVEVGRAVAKGRNDGDKAGSIRSLGRAGAK